MAPNKICELCKCELDEASFVSHILGKKHKRNVELNDSRNNTIIIKGYDYRASPRDVMNFFVNYGEIVNYFFFNGNKTLKIQYQDGEPVRHLTRNNIYFKGRKLNITSASISSNQQVSVNKAQKLVQETRDADTLHKDIITKLKSSEDFDQQIKILIDFIQDPEDIAIQKFENVKCDLEFVLQTNFNCKVHSFGSSVTGLGFRNCDIDIFVELLPIRQKGTHEEAAANAQKAKKMLHRSRKFTKIIAIVSAKTPIVKCVHKESNISCDVNFKNFFGVYNSQLLTFLISLDPRIKPLVMIIKYWAAYNKLAGSGKITNYALVILILFYLQQLEQPILPSIMFLQNFPEVELIEEGWNCGFCKDASVLPPVTNTQSVSQLLSGFYDFYFKFEYSLRVISPFAGKCYSRGLFDNADFVPSELHQYKSHLLKSGDVLRNKSSLVLQDPFELGHNLTSNVSLKLLTEFQNCCKHTKDNMESTLNSKPNLINLFKRAPKINIPKNTCEIVVAVGNHLSYLEHFKIPDENRDDQLLKIWFNKVEEYVLNILTDILFIKTNFINKSPDNKTQRVEGQADVHDRNIYESNTYLCTGQTPVWNNRRKINKDFLGGSICIQKEKKISEELLTCLVQNSDDCKSIINFNLTIIKFVNPTRILLRLLNNDDSNKTNFLQVSQYCLKKIQTLINQEIMKLKQPLSQNEMSPFEAALIRHVKNISDDKDITDVENNQLISTSVKDS